MSKPAPEALTLLLPVCNQSAALERALPAWMNWLAQSGREHELIVIDDGCTDTSAAFLDQSRIRYPTMRVLKHDSALGYGAGLRTGLSEARFPLLAYTGLDAGYAPADLGPLLKRLEDADPETRQRLDLVNGYRAGRAYPRWRRITGRAFRIMQRVTLSLHPVQKPGYLGEPAHRYALLLRCLFGLRVGDVDSKLKVFRCRIFDRLPIQSNGEFVHAEILAKANFFGCLMDELPLNGRSVPYTPQAYGITGSRRGEMMKVFFSPKFTAPQLLVSPELAQAPT